MKALFRIGKKDFVHLIELNLAILFTSTSGVLGRYISLSTPATIFFRSLGAAIFIYVFCRIARIELRLNFTRRTGLLFLSSVLLAAHWITYFFSLDLSNVAIAMLALYCHPAMTSILEPILLKTSFKKGDLFLTLVVLAGILIMVPSFNMDHPYTRAILLGLLSALFYTIRNISVRSLVQDFSSSAIMFYQCAFASVILIPALFMSNLEVVQKEWPALIILALVTTALGHTLFVRSFRYFSATSASILASALPVYGIIWGYLLLDEIPSSRTIIGGLLILSVVVYKSYDRR